MEQALVRFGRFVNDMEGQLPGTNKGNGDAYIALAQFLLESRRGGSEYDQSHLPVRSNSTRPWATRCARCTSTQGWPTSPPRRTIATIRAPYARSADNIVNRKYYVTGGVGSGETAEGFGGDYSLAQQRLLRILFELRTSVLPIQAQSRLPRREVTSISTRRRSTTPCSAPLTSKARISATRIRS